MIRLALRVRREDAEIALAELLELAPAGVEEVDDGGEIVEYAVYGAPGELPALPDLRAAAGAAFVDVSTTEVGDDWGERWRDFHQPIELGGRVRVRAPWHEPAGDGLIDIAIDPGQAFGTGAHATTRLCLELMLGLEPGGAFLDVGCGSGVLAIAAGLLGWDPVTAVDNDIESVTAAIENARVNGVAVAVSRVDLRHDALPGADVVVANLVRPLLLEFAARLQHAPRTLILGGLLVHEGDEIATAFAARGFTERERRSADGWAALLLRS